MNKIASFAVAALIAAGAAVGASAPAKAAVSLSIGVGGPLYYGYDYYRPCRWYFDHGYPAPRRCYNDYVGFYGPHVYISDGFVFRDRAHWGHWRYRSDYRRWRSYDWERHHHDWDRHHDHDHDWDDHHHHHHH